MLGDVMRRHRVAAGLTQEQLALRAGADRGYISEIELDIKSPTVDMLIRLCRVTGARPSEILAEIEDSYRLRRRKKE
jgi:transcriptional regulator with XRE-family HTH domain